MTMRDEDPALAKAAQRLQDLGLTAAEAVLYCTALQICGGAPFSGYKLAQVMGRDPANVAKTLSALVRLQAVTVVQEKPRLYLPSDPVAFTDRILARMRDSGRDAVDLLQRCRAPEPVGVAAALANPEQVFARARTLLAGCVRTAIVFGAKHSLREIGAELEALGAESGRRVRALCPAAMVAEKVDISVFAPQDDLADLLAHDFLQLVVDDRYWLSAARDDETDNGLRGWWGDQPILAAITGGALNLAWCAGRESGPAAPVTPPLPDPEPAPEPEEGLTFLMRHPATEGKDKGEP